MKKKTGALVLAAGVLFGGAGLFVNHSYALEQTISIEGINYVSLQQMGQKYNFNVESSGGKVKVVGEATNLEIPVGGTVFIINGREHIAQVPAKSAQDQTWISAKDWAEMFNLALTHYDKVSHMTPVDSTAVTNDAILDTRTYRVSDDWGEKVPEGVRKHGSPNKIITPTSDGVIYEKSVLNPELQNVTQR